MPSYTQAPACDYAIQFVQTLVALDGTEQQAKWVDGNYSTLNTDPPSFSNFNTPYGGVTLPDSLIFSSITKEDDKCVYGVGLDGIENTDDDTDFFTCSPENNNAYHMLLNATLVGNLNPLGLHYNDVANFYVWPQDPCYSTQIIT